MKNINNKKGFTLIELMIVVAVVGILTAIAVPNYSKHLIKTNRIDGMKMLNEVMDQQHRYLARNRTYTTDLSASGLGYVNADSADGLLSEEGIYIITAKQCGNVSIASCVILFAKPVVGGKLQRDGDFTLSSRGAKTWNALDGWNHRGVGDNEPGTSGTVKGK